ncbi:MAG: type II toxin-antitoxin system RelE family toxin [Streptosporangiaceae bacterium]
MTRWRIEITRDAVKTLAKMDKPVRRRIQAAVDRLAYQPRPPGVVALKGDRGYLRLRVGDYRVVYRVEDDRLVVVVVDLGHRREISVVRPSKSYSGGFRITFQGVIRKLVSQ